MKRLIAFAGVCAVVLSAFGCSNKGQDMADRVNKKMVEKINKGDVKNEVAMKLAYATSLLEVRKEMNIKKDDKWTKTEKESMEKGLEKYEEEWKELIKKKWKK